MDTTKKKGALKCRRCFSEEVRRKIVKDIENGKASVSGVHREYDVSFTTIYRWLYKYSRHLHKGQVTVVQMKSEAYKTKELEKQIKDLEAALGRKQMEIDFLNKMIDIGKEELGVDLKKKYSTPPSIGSDQTKDSILTN